MIFSVSSAQSSLLVYQAVRALQHPAYDSDWCMVLKRIIRTHTAQDSQDPVLSLQQ